ncbi:MAG: hypothetical protein IJ938_04910 [Clostridia bacterium]|nr:hypothetical protein [Clostridia bacterium]MBR6692586.1 hypothetical protein [Clostridia bacterium]
MNTLRIFRIITICLAIIMLVFFFLTLFHLSFSDGEDQIPTILIAETLILYSLLFSGLALKNKDYVVYKRIIKNRPKVDFIYLKENIGEDIAITTITGEIKGTLIEVDGDWIKVKDHDMRPMEHIIKSSMALVISLK